MLAYVNNGTPAPWSGQAVNGVLHPLNIEDLWTDAELNAAGLYRVTLFAVPAGQVITGVPSYTLSGNVVQQSYTTAAAPPPTQEYLIAYANQKQWATATGGRTVTVAGNPVAFHTDAQSLSLMTGKALRFQQPNAPASVEWQTGATTFVTIAAADFMTAAAAVADFIQSTFDALPGVIANIGSDAVTTTAQIDAVFAAL